MRTNKLIGITQRVVHHEKYNEIRDCIDQRWYELILAIGCIPLPLPNISVEHVPVLIETIGLNGIVLSGGNSIALPGVEDDISPERDAFEKALLDESFRQNIPVLGVCRGMQLINVYLGGRLCAITKHAGKHRHNIKPASHEQSARFPDNVNTYHNWAVPSDGLADSLKALAYDDDGNIEAFTHKSELAMGVMWHPEREQPFNNLDTKMIRDLFL